MKICLHCKVEKPLSNYYKCGKYYASHCRACHNIKEKKYRATKINEVKTIVTYEDKFNLLISFLYKRFVLDMNDVNAYVTLFDITTVKTHGKFNSDYQLDLKGEYNWILKELKDNYNIDVLKDSLSFYRWYQKEFRPLM